MRYDEQLAKIENVINQPMRKFKPDALRGVIERYEAKTPNLSCIRRSTREKNSRNIKKLRIPQPQVAR